MIKLAWLNRADDASLSASSEVSTLPASNVQQAHLARPWSTEAGVTSAYILFDMLAAVACSLLAVLGTNLTAAATVRLRASDADPTAAAGDLLDTGVLAGGVKEGYGAIYKAFNEVTARYWRLDLEDASLTEGIRVGRVFIGPSWSPTYGQEFGWSVTPHDPSSVGESYGGQSYPENKPKRRLLEFELAWESESAMYGNAFAMARANGVVKDVLAIHDINGAYLSEQAVWGLLDGVQPLVHWTTRTFRQKFRIKERL